MFNTVFHHFIRQYFVFKSQKVGLIPQLWHKWEEKWRRSEWRRCSIPARPLTSWPWWSVRCYIGRVNLNPGKALVSSEVPALLSAVEHCAFEQQQIKLISASYYLHCPCFDTNFTIILPRFTWLSHPVIVNKGPASMAATGWEPQSAARVFV